LEFKNFAKGGISKMTLKEKAQRLLSDFKGDDYALGVGIINKIGEYAKEYGDNVLLISKVGSLMKKINKNLELVRDARARIAEGPFWDQKSRCYIG
jgi:alcohol dehydrogenase